LKHSASLYMHARCRYAMVTLIGLSAHFATSWQ
jgi:hypothetical protein